MSERGWLVSSQTYSPSAELAAPDRRNHAAADALPDSRPTGADGRALADLCCELGAELLDVVVAPAGLDAAVHGVAVHDPLDPPGTGLSVGDVVLGVGTAEDDDGAALTLVLAAGLVGAAAVVCRRRGAPSGELIAGAQRAGIALLATDPDVPWGELYSLVRTWLTADVRSDLRGRPASPTGDLVALADATAAVAGGPVTIEDMPGRVLAFSQNGQEVDAARAGTILGRRVPDEWMRRLHRIGAMRELMEREGVVSVSLPGARPRRAIAIRAGEQVLGAIWLAVAGDGVPARADDALREAAQIAGLHLMRQRVFDDLEKRVRGGMVRMLLRGDGLPAPMLARLGFPGDGELVVVAVQVGEGGDGTADEHDRVVSLAVEHLRAYRWHAAGAELDGRVYLLVALDGHADRQALPRIIGDCLARARHALQLSLRVGIGQEVAATADVSVARRRADQCLDLGPPSVALVRFEEIGGRALLADAQAFLSAHPAAITPGVQRLLDHDREQGTALVPTLRAYLDAFGDASVAAERLHVHVNTLRYRVRRVADLVDTDLHDPDARLSLELQLRNLDVNAGL
jgi:hypothetical protein